MVYNPDEVEKDNVGGCWKCKTQLTLKNEQVKCDKCGALIRWWCNSCSEPFDIIDKKTKKKLHECSVCGYFICPHCDVCSWNCDKFKWQKEILEILKKDIPIGKFPTLVNRVSEIVEYIEIIKTSKERKTCFNGVPISYSKGRIKNLMAKIDGFKIKNENDRQNFLKRIEDATALELGTEITINNIREDGSYGQEYRDALNLLVCLGKFKIKIMKNKDDKEYCVFIREDRERCYKLSEDDLIITFCPKCKKIYSNNQKMVCDICLWKRGGKKGQRVELKQRLNNCDTCQLYRGDFNKNDGKD